MTLPRRLALLLALLALLLVALWYRDRIKAKAPSPLSSLAILQQFEEQEARKYWQPELRAQQYGRAIENFWDTLNAGTNKLQVVQGFALSQIALAIYDPPRALPQNIQVRAPSGRQRKLTGEEWQHFVQQARAAGWELAQCEFRHTRFTPQPARSDFYFSAHLTNAERQERAILEGTLGIAWNGDAVDSVDASSLELRSTTGPPAFRAIFDEEIAPRDGSYFIDPLMVWDLDRDGTPEILLAAKNWLWRRNSSGQWSHSPLCHHDPGLIFSAALGDFNGDGKVDLMCANFDGLVLFEGSSSGSFPNPPRKVWAAAPRLKYGQALAVGDVNGDGALDLFLGQYKVPYDKGQMPKPYFDANDGYPSFLLLNDGHGNFSDATQSAGLSAKRGRRVYNASLLDLDGDNDLDLLAVSDFAGIDAYQNDGHGRFKDVTDTWFPQRAGLGMASDFADFNRDGRLDVLMIGMNSPTAERLEALGLQRPYDLPDAHRRASVTFGNRLLFGGSDGVFRATGMSLPVARTGWSWGCAAADLNNDGYPDLYFANGHETRATVRDYEPEFWLHDIYVGDSMENSLAQAYFREKISRTRGQGWSYGGYEKNRLFFNLGGTNFVECAWLFGVALQDDCRNVVAEDLDNDGRLDLIVTAFEVYPKPRQTLKIFRNELPVQRLYSRQPVPQTEWGKVLSPQPNSLQPILAGGSYRSQQQPVLRLLPPK